MGKRSKEEHPPVEEEQAKVKKSKKAKKEVEEAGDKPVKDKKDKKEKKEKKERKESKEEVVEKTEKKEKKEKTEKKEKKEKSKKKEKEKKETAEAKAQAPALSLAERMAAQNAKKKAKEELASLQREAAAAAAEAAEAVAAAEAAPPPPAGGIARWPTQTKDGKRTQGEANAASLKHPCLVCECSFTGAQQLADHHAGKKHKRKEAWVQNQLANGWSTAGGAAKGPAAPGVVTGQMRCHDACCDKRCVLGANFCAKHGGVAPE